MNRYLMICFYLGLIFHLLATPTKGEEVRVFIYTDCKNSDCMNQIREQIKSINFRELIVVPYKCILAKGDTSYFIDLKSIDNISEVYDGEINTDMISDPIAKDFATWWNNKQIQSDLTLSNASSTISTAVFDEPIPDLLDTPKIDPKLEGLETIETDLLKEGNFIISNQTQFIEAADVVKKFMQNIEQGRSFEAKKHVLSTSKKIISSVDKAVNDFKIKNIKSSDFKYFLKDMNGDNANIYLAKMRNGYLIVTSTVNLEKINGRWKIKDIVNK